MTWPRPRFWKLETCVPSLDVVSLSKSFDVHPAVADVSFSLAEGQVLALLGPSGSGKSTLLNLIAGLEAPDAGDIRWDGQSLLGVPTHQRGFGLMFQDYALFPHKDVAENVGFGLRMQGQSRAEVTNGVTWALGLVGLAGFERRNVSNLSGGEQQRVALARALAPRPRLLMLDEPLGALDRALRERLLDELGGILRRLRQTAIYVTHDQDEAFALADRILVLRDGRVAQAGAPAEVYAAPINRFVAEFRGLTNILPGVVQHEAGRSTVLTTLGAVALGERQLAPGTPVEVVLRPDGARLAEAGPNGAGGLELDGKIVEKSFRGNQNWVTLELEHSRLRFTFPPDQALPATGERLSLYLRPTGLYVMPAGNPEPPAGTDSHV
jgi:ABC-type Fe3+/spermidine/putrescine transport system ATPase subunit